MPSYAELQAEHQALLDRLDRGEAPAALLGPVREHIARVQAASAGIAASRDRDQLRANLRFWASFIFDNTGVYPDTALRPAALGERPTPPPPAPLSRGLLLAAGAGGLCLVLALCAGLYVLRPYIVGPGGATEPISTGTRPVQEVTDTPTLESGLTVVPPSHTPGPSPTASATFHPSVTPPTPTGTASASPSPRPSDTPPITPSPPAVVRTMLLAEAAQSDGGDCAFRTVEISVDGAGLLSPNDLGVALAELRYPGSREADSVAEMGPEGGRLFLETFNLDAPEPVLLSVVHPRLTFASVVLQFGPGCANNVAKVVYTARQVESLLAKEAPEAGDLALGWTLDSWGPAPQDPREWVASLRLFARGGDDRYIFWDGARFLNDDDDPQVTLTGAACAPAQHVVGVSSAGRSVLREIVLQSPYCP